MLENFLRRSTIILVIFLSGCFLAISSAKSMGDEENELGEDWTKLRIIWRSADRSKPIRKVLLEGPLFENAKERVAGKVLNVDLKAQSRWNYAAIGWYPPYTRLRHEEDWYAQEQEYYGSQREFAFKDLKLFGSIVYFVDATSSAAAGSASQLKRCPPIYFGGEFAPFGEEPIEKDDIILYLLPDWNLAPLSR